MYLIQYTGLTDKTGKVII